MIPKTLFSALHRFKPVQVKRNDISKPGLDLCLSKLCKNFSTTLSFPRIEHETTQGFNKSKAKIILSLNFKSPDDCLPFYKLPIKKLVEIQKITKDDERKKFCDNRLYYISSKIKCDPAIVSEKLARRTFVYQLSFDWLEKSLDSLLEKGVTGDRILRDLWVLKYNHRTIEERLEKIKEMGIDVLYPWMVRCTSNILEKYIHLSQETKDILGDSNTTQMYLANRLNISIEDVEDICVKMPALRTMRVIKVKKFLDFLIDEGFSVEDIAQKPRVLASSPKTIKYRMDKLRTLGFNETNLNALCKSTKHFNKYYESIKQIKKDSVVA